MFLKQKKLFSKLNVEECSNRAGGLFKRLLLEREGRVREVREGSYLCTSSNTSVGVVVKGYVPHKIIILGKIIRVRYYLSTKTFICL